MNDLEDSTHSNDVIYFLAINSDREFFDPTDGLMQCLSNDHPNTKRWSQRVPIDDSGATIIRDRFTEKRGKILFAKPIWWQSQTMVHINGSEGHYLMRRKDGRWSAVLFGLYDIE